MGNKKPCSICFNARVDETGELTDNNDFSSRSIGVFDKGYRSMLESGWGRPMRIVFEKWSTERQQWESVGDYEPECCPNCGRKLDEYKPKKKKQTTNKKRNYFRKCGVCGDRHEQSEMIRTDKSPNGWVCCECRDTESGNFFDEWSESV